MSNDEVCSILNAINSKNTGKSTKFAVKLLRDYCIVKEYDIDFENLSTSDLNLLLKEFYINLRQQNGELYTKRSFLVIRQSLNRYLRNPPVYKTFNIIDGQEFNEANTAFQSMCKRVREEGKGKVHHTPTIQKDDVQKLYLPPHVFNTDIPSGLLNKVLFEIMLYFCRRGHANVREMKPSDFEVSTDDNGKRFICKVTSDLTKNHQGLCNEQFEPEGGRMYETGTQRPVKSFIKYLDKINPMGEALWQRPRNPFIDSGIWFERKPLGNNTLGEFMSEISERAALSRIYTNHCTRATCITLLSEVGFEGRHIITISRNRSEEIIKSYCRDKSNEQKRDMSKFISNFTIVENTSNTIDVSNEESNSKSTEYCEFDTAITDDELVLSASPTDSLINQIVENEAQPLTKVVPVNEITDSKLSIFKIGKS